MNESEDENVLVVSHKTVFDVPLEEIATAHRRLDASLTVLMSERRAWDEIDAKYGRAPKNAKYVGLSDDVEESSTSRNRKSKKLMIKRLVFSSSESEKTVKINRSALDSAGNVRASVRYRDVRVYCFSTAALVKCLKKVSLARSSNGAKSFLSLKNDIVPEMCKAQFWNTVATNKCDDGKENDVVENGGTLSKPVLAIICRPEQQRDNFACEIERVTPHFLEISKEILSSAPIFSRPRTRSRDTKTSSPLTSNSEVKPSSARTVRYSPAFSSAKKRTSNVPSFLATLASALIRR